MEIDIGAEFFANLSSKMDGISSRLDKLNRMKPVHYPVAASGQQGAAVGELDISVNDTPPAGRIWNILSVSINTTLAGGIFSPSSFGGIGSVTSPAAGATIAQTAFLAEGWYDVTATVFLTGTVAAADANNMQYQNGTATPTLPVVPADNVPTTVTVRSFFTTNQRAKIVAVAAGTVGSVYNASIVATPVTAYAASAGMSADVFLGQNLLTPDVSSQILNNEQFTVPSVYYFPRESVWSHRGETIFARVYQVPANATMTLVARIAEYPLEAVEALTI